MSLSPILLNNQLFKQPTTARDYRINIQSENQALDGGMQRNRMSSAANPLGYKYAADLVWEDLAPADFNLILGVLSNGSGITYSNPSSKYGALTYSGLTFYDEPDPYVAGESLLTKLSVTIRQI